MYPNFCTNDVDQYETEYFKSYNQDIAAYELLEEVIPEKIEESDIDRLLKPICMEDILADEEKESLPNNNENDDTQNSTGSINIETSEISQSIQSDPVLVVQAKPELATDSVEIEAIPLLPTPTEVKPSMPKPSWKTLTKEQFDEDLASILKTSYAKIEKFLRDNPNRSDAARVEFARNTKKALHTIMNKYYSKRSSSAKFIQLQFPLLKEFYNRASSFIGEESPRMVRDGITEFSFYALFLQSPGY